MEIAEGFDNGIVAFLGSAGGRESLEAVGGIAALSGSGGDVSVMASAVEAIAIANSKPVIESEAGVVGGLDGYGDSDRRGCAGYDDLGRGASSWRGRLSDELNVDFLNGDIVLGHGSG